MDKYKYEKAVKPVDHHHHDHEEEEDGHAHGRFAA
jgi:hypothetical protein